MCSYDFGFLKSGQFDPQLLCDDEAFLEQFQESSRLYSCTVVSGGDGHVFDDFSFNELVIVGQKFSEHLITRDETGCSAEAHLRCFMASINALKLIRTGIVKFQPNWNETQLLSEFFGTLQAVFRLCTPTSSASSDQSELSSLLVKYSIHIVSNFSIVNEDNARRMLTIFGRQFVHIFQTTSCDIAFSSQFLCALHRCFYNCKISSWHGAITFLDENALRCLSHVILFQLMTESNSQQSFDTFKMILRWSGFMSSMWHELSSKERLFIVEVLHDEAERLDADGSFEKLGIPGRSGHNGKITCLSEFLHQSRIDFLCKLEADEMSSIIAGDNHVDSNEDDDLFHPLLALLHIISQYFHILEEPKSDSILLAKTIELLKVLQPSVKPVKSFSKSERTSLGQTRKELVGLVGNLVYKNRANQDLVRETGGLQLLLNLTYIDESCPIVQQWSLLAIRNLCEGNEQNQNFISGLKLEKVEKMSQELKGVGLKAEVKDGRLSFCNGNKE